MSDPGGGGVHAGARSVDEEAWVEDDRDAMVIEDPIQPHQMQEPTYLEYALRFVVAYASNPWFILLCVVGLYMFYQRKVKPFLGEVGYSYSTWQEQRRAAAEVAAQKKNPDIYREKIEAMDRARARQQAMHEAAAREHAEKVKAKEEERRAEKVKQLEALQNGQGYNNKSSSQKKSTLRSDDYSPLMGGGGSDTGFRPARRAGPSSGGGG